MKIVISFVFLSLIHREVSSTSIRNIFKQFRPQNYQITAETSAECKETLLKHPPWFCCYYPALTLTSDQRRSCKEKCSKDQDAKCCFHDCNYEITGIFDNGKFNKDKILSG